MEKFLQQPKTRREVLKGIGKAGAALGAVSIGILPQDGSAEPSVNKGRLPDKEQADEKPIVETKGKAEKDPVLEDPVAQIILEESNKLAREQFAFDKISEAKAKYEEIITRISQRIRQVPELSSHSLSKKDGISESDISDYLKEKKYFFGLGNRHLKNSKGEKRHYIRFDLSEINDRRTESVRKYYPEYIKYPLKVEPIEVLFVGDNLASQLSQKLQETVNTDFQGTIRPSSQGQPDIVIDEGVIDRDKQIQASREERIQATIANEMGHVLWNTVSRANSKNFNKPITIGGKQYTIYQLEEFFSDITMLKYGAESDEMFMRLLNRRMNAEKTLDYVLSKDLFYSQTMAIFKQMGIKGTSIHRHKIPEFRKKLLDDTLIYSFFQIIGSINNHVRKRNRKK